MHCNNKNESKYFYKNKRFYRCLPNSYLPTNCIANANTCPNTTHVMESVRIPLIAVIDPFGTSVFNIAFVFLMTEKQSRKFTVNESISNKYEYCYHQKPLNLFNCISTSHPHKEAYFLNSC